MGSAFAWSERLGPLYSLTLKQILNVSEAVNPAPHVPEAPQSLNNELASLYTNLGHLRIAIHAPRKSDFPDGWQADVDQLADDCLSTLNDIHIVLDKARTTTISASKSEVCTVVRFLFNDKHLSLLSRRIVTQNGILQILLSALSETRSAYIEDRLEEIHDRVEKLAGARQRMREALDIDNSEPTQSQEVPKANEQRQKTLPILQVKAEDDSETLPAKASEIVEKAVELLKRAAETTTSNKQREAPQDEAATDSNSELGPAILQRVMSETKPSSAEKTAIDMILDKTWTLSRHRRLKGDSTWEEKTPLQFKGCSSLRFRIGLSLSSGLSLWVVNDEGDLGHQRLTGFWTDGVFVRNGVVVTDEAPEYTDDMDNVNMVADEFTFTSTQEAKDFEFCLSTAMPMVHTARQIYVAAIRNFDPDFAESMSARELKKRAFSFSIW